MSHTQKHRCRPEVNQCDDRLLLTSGVAHGVAPLAALHAEALAAGKRNHLLAAAQHAQQIAALRHAQQLRLAALHHPAHSPLSARHPRSTTNFSAPVVQVPTSTVPTSPVPTSPGAPTPAGTTGTPPVPSVSGVMSAMEQQIVDLTNQQRTANGLPPLTVNTQLVKMAEIQSSDMAQFQDMSHTLSQAALPDLQSRASYVGYNYSWLGENIAAGYPDASSVVAAWMASPEHRANLLNTNFTQIGVAVAYDSSGTSYFTQVFGEPA